MSGLPHDALFKTVFSDPVNAEAELRAVLPPALAAALVPGSLVLEPGSFVDEELRATHADLLFRARFVDGEALVYVLFEHQSSEDRWMPVRIARYVLRIWEREIERDPRRESLPAVIPIVVHQGPRQWQRPTELGELIHAPAALDALRPRWTFVLDDLAALSDASLLARAVPPFAALTLAALRDSRDLRDAAAWLVRWARLVRELVAQGDVGRALGLVVRYLVNVRPDLDLEALARSADTIALGAGEPIMTTARQLIEKGMEKGIEKGLDAGRREILRRVLERRFGPLAEPNASRLSHASAAEIDRWIDQMLDAPSVDDALS